MKRPWMPLYIADYLADTAHLGALESGAYLHLIMHYWQTGKLPSEPRELARIAKVSAHSWKKLSPALQKFFHDGWRHKRIDEELARADDISEKRSAAAKSRHVDKPAKAPAIAEQKKTHSPSQSQQTEEETSLRSVAASSPRDDGWPSDFREQFWIAYPRKLEKKAALLALERVRKGGAAPWDKLIGAVRAYAATADPQFTKHPTTWLSKGCWDDEPAQPRGPHERSGQNRTNSAPGSSQTHGDAVVAGVANFAARYNRDKSANPGGSVSGRDDTAGGADADRSAAGGDQSAPRQSQLLLTGNSGERH